MLLLQASRMEVETIYREQWGAALSTLIRLLGDFDLAEDSLQEAFTIAIEQWRREGLPANPRAWLVSTARHKAIDQLRRRRRVEARSPDALIDVAGAAVVPDDVDDAAMPDDRLSLIFTCCHPALAEESQVALILRTLCGLTTEEVAKAFLVPVSTLAQRIVRTKQKIAKAKISFRVPAKADLPARLESVMLVVYLIFNEGYAASSGDSLVRRELSGEAIRLGRLLSELMPEFAEIRALLALMLLHDSRCRARTDAANQLIPLEEQDRTRWDQEEIQEGLAVLESALRLGGAGVYSLQASIAALHARAARAADTDWTQIAGLYRALLRIAPSPVIELNYAAALGMAKGPEAGLRLLEAIQSTGELDHYYLLPAAKADLLRRAGRRDEAAEAYRAALTLVRSGPERQYLRRRLGEVANGPFPD